MKEKLSLKNRITDALRQSGFSVFYYEMTDSTNTRAEEYARDGHEELALPAVFIAEAQTEGRGRLGRSFYSPETTGLYMTLLIDTTGRECGLVGITSIAAVALRRAIDDVFGVKVGIKWVNDLYVGGKKIAGILARSVLREGKSLVAIGIGVNISTEKFPEELWDIAGSLMGENIDKNDLAEKKILLAHRFCGYVMEYIEPRMLAEAMREYREASLVIGRRIKFTENGCSTSGLAVGVGDDGALLVDTDDGGKVELISGEISVRLE